jgi:methyltransferase-like protein
MKALLYTFANEWPRSMNLEQLQAGMNDLLSTSVVVGDQQLEESSLRPIRAQLLQMMVRGDVEFRFLPDRFTTKITDKPRVSALSRLQAKGSDAMTTQKHVIMRSDPLSRLVIQQLDGTKNKAAITQFIKKLSDDKKIKINVQGPKPPEMEKVLDATVDKVLRHIQRAGMLIA